MNDRDNTLKTILNKIEDQGILEAIGDGISIQDRNYRVIYQNQIHKNFVGEHIGEYCYKAYEKRENVCDGCPVARAFQDGKTHTEQRSAPTEQGLSYFEITASPLRDVKGQIIAGIESARDITNNKKAEKALLESEAKFRNVVESSPMGMHMYHLESDNRLVFTGYNHAADQILGVDNSQFIGKTIEEAFPPLAATEVPERYRRAATQGESWINEQITYKDDNISGAFQVHAFQAEPAKMVAMFLDITEKKKAEYELKARAEEITALNELIQKVSSNLDLEKTVNEALDGLVSLIKPDTVFLFLRDGDSLLAKGYRFSSEKYVQKEIKRHKIGNCMCGLAVTEGKPIFSRDIFSDLRCTWDECKNAGMHSFAALPLKKGDSVIGVLGIGSALHVNFEERASFLETLAGEISIGLQNALLFEEATHHSEEIESANKELHKEIGVRVRAEKEQRRLTEELIIKNKELEQVLYVTSHDLRSPLVNVEGYGRELEYSLKDLMTSVDHADVPTSITDKITPIVKEDIPESLHYIRTSVSKMDMLLRGILSLSRLGRYELTINEIDMNAMMSDIVDSHRFKLNELNIKTDISGLPYCKGDSSQINQVFSNLLDNAVKYTDPEQPGVIHISGYTDKDQSVYCMADNGIGIAADHQDKIFEIFHQLAPNRVKGEGMGLTIAHRIIERHNGKIWVESELGRGSKFFVSLPS
jgi:PAS domain S-box-containing protein